METVHTLGAAPFLKTILMAAVHAEFFHTTDTLKALSIDNLQHSPTSVLFLSLVGGSSTETGSAYFLATERNVQVRCIQCCIGGSLGTAHNMD